MTERVFNFSAGPAVLPLPVLEEVREHLLALPGVGISILESSHRSSWFTDIIEEAESNLRRLLAVPDDYRVLFLQGGATLQFSMVPMNFLRPSDRPASYLLTGSWSSKAIKEATREGEVEVAWDGKAEGYRRVPADDELALPDQAAYVYFCSNETIQGVQFQSEPEVGNRPLVCDASSDFLSRPLAIERYALLHGCAQKNAGPAGLTIVLVHDDFLARHVEDQHTLLDYRKLASEGSRLNTPPTFAIYVFMLVTRWLQNEVGGLEAMAERNRAQAARLYQVIDESGDFYRGHAEPECRSAMNVTFRLPSEELEQGFLAEARKRGLRELEGHRSVGGIRASIYNAMPDEGIEALSSFMLEYRDAHR